MTVRVPRALRLCACALLSLAPATLAQETGEYRALYDALVSLSPDPARVATVTSPLVLMRPGFQLTLQNGQLSLLTVQGEAVGAAFVGEASATVAPVLDVEQRELQRRLGSPTLTTDVGAAAFFFTDATLEEFEAELSFGPGTVEGGAGRIADRATDFLRGEEDGEYDRAMMTALLNDRETGFFHVHMDVADGPDLFYRYDEAAAEEATFGRDGPRDTYEVLTRFHPGEHYREGAWLEEEPGHLIAIDSYDMDVRIDDDAITMWMAGAVEITPKQDGAVWVPLSLFQDLEVDRMAWAGGGDAVFYRPDNSGALWLRLPETSVAGQHLTLELAYHGDLGQREGGWYGLLSPTGWYPRYARGWSNFDLTFHVPDNLHLVSVGERVENVQREDTITTRWVTERPALHASFNVGPFEVEEFGEVEGASQLTIQIQDEGHERLQDAGALQQANVGYQVGLDVANSIAFYSQVYGPALSDRFMVAEIPYGHGQAFPGMIHLSYITYFVTRQSGADESFRAHEVAHQWWGLGVQEKTPRDAWLEEGLSEFSSLWYMSEVKFDPERVLELLEEKKKALVDLKDEAGPIFLGRYHLQDAEDGGEHYSRVVYDKGAWVFHMLRTLLTDVSTMDDSVFERAMKNLYAQHRGGELSTAELQSHFEAETGLDLNWFFQQWVYGTEIPRYRFSYTGRTLDDGQYQLFGKVVAEEVSQGFVSFVPIRIDFEDGSFARVRYAVQGRETLIEFPPLPSEPDDVVFNDLQGVLAEVDNDGWSGPDPWGDGPGARHPPR